MDSIPSSVAFDAQPEGNAMTDDNPLALDPETMRRLGYSTVDLLVDRLLAPARPVPYAGGRAQMIRNLGGPPPEDA